jgi:hypothetical protein
MMLLLDAIAIIILGGMMLIPVVNVFVGIIVGAGLAGLPGGLLGLALAIAVTAAEKLLGERRGWFEVVHENHSAVASVQRPARARWTKRRMMHGRAFAPPTRPPLPSVQPSENYARSLH